ncbi:MAG: priA, partial [Candidatus Berkelbacteria bacterium]|nr:priA [Candidatus Berkelbacteria bacterium]
MQIAQIVPKVNTQDEGIFDYSIPPEILPMIKPGILVEIPFHGRDIQGIVINIKRFSK